MNLEPFTKQLSRNAGTIRSLVQGVTEVEARWKPGPDAWSILEVINHLCDEEREDFRARLNFLLYDRGKLWPPIDPERWVIERQYNQRDLESSLSRFLEERQTSVVWLEDLTSPDWDATYDASFGEITAGDVLASWVAHDFLHIRQLAELHWIYTSVLASPYRIDYAGPW